MATQSTLSDLMLAASRADFNAEHHEQVCPAWKAGRDCRACDEYQDDILTNDRRLRDHFEAMIDAASCPVIGCDCAEKKVG